MKKLKIGCGKTIGAKVDGASQEKPKESESTAGQKEVAMSGVKVGHQARQF